MLTRAVTALYISKGSTFIFSQFFYCEKGNDKNTNFYFLNQFHFKFTWVTWLFCPKPIFELHRNIDASDSTLSKQYENYSYTIVMVATKYNVYLI